MKGNHRVADGRGACRYCHGALWRIGQTSAGSQKYKCRSCGKFSSSATEPTLQRRMEREAIRAHALAFRSAVTLAEVIALDAKALGMDTSKMDFSYFENFVRAPEAARRRGVSKQRVNKLIHEGRLDVMKLGGRTWIRQPIRVE